MSQNETIRGPRYPKRARFQLEHIPACRTDPEQMFLPDGIRGPAKYAHMAAAKAICSSCQLWEQCRRESILNGEEYGVWGGLDADERSRILDQTEVS